MDLYLTTKVETPQVVFCFIDLKCESNCGCISRSQKKTPHFSNPWAYQFLGVFTRWLRFREGNPSQHPLVFGRVLTGPNV